MQSSSSSEKKRIAHQPTVNFDKINVFTPSNVSNQKNVGHPKKKQVNKSKQPKQDGFINDGDEDNDDKTTNSTTNFYKDALSGSTTNECNILTKTQEKEFKLEFERQFNNYTGRLREKKEKTVLNEKLIGDLQIRHAFKQQQQTIKRRTKEPVPVEFLDVEPINNQIILPESKLREISGRNLDWDQFLDLKGKNIITNLSKIPPVDYFKNAPLANIWKDFAKPGIFVELRNPYVMDKNSYWIAKIIHFAGYRALVRFVDFEDEDESPGFMEWISFCSGVGKALGWAAMEGKKLVPGKIISGMSEETVQKNLQELYASNQENNTIPQDHKESIIKQIEKMRTVDHTIPVECLDLVKYHETRLAKITTILGNRYHVSYFDDDGVRSYPIGFKKGFCHSVHSESIHPFGFSHTIGVKLNGNPKNLTCSPLPPESFPSWPSDQISIQVGMRLETRHPFSTQRIVGAIITKVFKYGYFQIETRDEKPSFRSSFVYHITSPLIYPVGFGKRHGISVEYADPTGKHQEERLRLDLESLPPRSPQKFAVGMKVEAIDIRDSRMALAATIQKVAGHMLFIHFDKWDRNNDENYSWVDCESGDLYPLGYSEMTAIDWQGAVDEDS